MRATSTETMNSSISMSPSPSYALQWEAEEKVTAIRKEKGGAFESAEEFDHHPMQTAACGVCRRADATEESPAVWPYLVYGEVTVPVITQDGGSLTVALSEVMPLRL